MELTYQSVLAAGGLMLEFVVACALLAWLLKTAGIVPTRVKTGFAEAEFAQRVFEAPAAPRSRRGSTASTPLPADRMHTAFFRRFEESQADILAQTNLVRQQAPDSLSYQEAWLTVMMRWVPLALMESISEVAGEASEPKSEEPAQGQ